MQDPFWHRVEIDLSEVIVRADGGEVVIDDALHHHVIAILKSVEVMEDKALRGFKDAGLLPRELTGIPRNQPETPLAARFGLQTLGCPFFTGDEGQGVEGDGVLQEHRPIGGDGEVVQEGETREAVGTIVQQGSSVRALRGEFHQTDGAAGTGLDPKGDHAGPPVVAGVEAGMGTEGLTLFQHAVQP